MVKVTIDPHAGFCPGVTRSISTAVEVLSIAKPAYSLGELVHCSEELNRLESEGLKVISIEDLPGITDSNILIRAHGVTPDTQFRLNMSDNTVVDATCDIVRRLQQKVKTVSHQMNAQDGQVVIFGKKKHPEVEGLKGYCHSRLIITEHPDDLSGINPDKPVSVFAQTTSNVEDFESFITNLYKSYELQGKDKSGIRVFNTICGSIKKRVPRLKEFAHEHDVIVFVSGDNSSNGAYLSYMAQMENKKTYKISSELQLDPDWFMNAQKIGISGAASTPVWLLEKVASAINSIVNP